MLNLAYDLNLNLPLQRGVSGSGRPSSWGEAKGQGGHRPPSFPLGFSLSCCWDWEVVVSSPQSLGPRDNAPVRASSPFLFFLPMVTGSVGDWLWLSRTCFRLSRKFQISGWKERCWDHFSWFGSRIDFFFRLLLFNSKGEFLPTGQSYGDISSKVQTWYLSSPIVSRLG